MNSITDLMQQNACLMQQNACLMQQLADIHATFQYNLSTQVEKAKADMKQQIATKKTTATKPELLSKEQFLKQFRNGDVPAAVVGQFFNIKGRDLPHGLERYNPDPNKPHQYIRVVRAEGSGTGYVPPGGDVDYSDIEAPATPGGASLELTAPKAPEKQSLTKSFTSDGDSNSVAMKLSEAFMGEQ